MIIGISGKKRAGKDYFGSLLYERLTCEVYKFAYPLYTLVDLIQKRNNQELINELARQSYLAGCAINYYQTAEDLLDAPFIGELEDGKPRKLLQWVGTDYFRERVDSEWWVKIARAYAINDVNVFTDVRFPNEANICDVNLRLVGGLSNDNHISEELKFDYDYIIDNTEKSPTRAAVAVTEFIDWLEGQGYIGDIHFRG